MTYSQKFIDLVNIANEKSIAFYKKAENKNKPNPFYIGFGNPNANILFIGKEKGFSVENESQLKTESIDNVKQWKFLIEKNVFDYKYKFDNVDYSSNFYNPLQPYHEILGGKGQGQTWYYYNKLAQLINGVSFERSRFQLCSSIFMTELNHQPSKTSPGKTELQEAIKNRIMFLKENAFYQNFEITILAVGDYVNEAQIKELFGESLVLLPIDEELKHKQKLLFYKDTQTNRLIINTRQLSNQFPTKYLENIAKIIHDERRK